MELITIDILVRFVAKAWADQFALSMRKGDVDKQEIGRRLSLMDPKTMTAADVEATIGNKSWTTIKCEECRQDVTAAILFDTSDDNGCTVCVACIRKAVALVANKK